MERITYRKTLDVHKNGVQFLLQGFQTADNMSRVVEVSLMASGDAIDFPLERIVAVMYVTTPGASEPSINECTIKDNKVVYEVLPIVEEGITTMQLKLIETSPEGAKSVLASPEFAVEVTKSNINDDGTELDKYISSKFGEYVFENNDYKRNPKFTAIEEFISMAEAAYGTRLKGIELTSDCMFRATYYDGTLYETDVLQKLFLNGNVLLSESFAHGGTGVRSGEDTDNSKYYSNVSKSEALNAKDIMENSQEILDEVRLHGVYTAFHVNFETGEVEYVSPSFNFDINPETGELDAIARSSTIQETVHVMVEDWLAENGYEFEKLKELSGTYSGIIDTTTTHTREISELKGASESHNDSILALGESVSTPSFLAFVGNNTDMVEAAFGKGNEDENLGIGNALRMYANYKGNTENIDFLDGYDKYAELVKDHKQDLISNESLYGIIKASSYANNILMNTRSNLPEIVLYDSGNTEYLSLTSANFSTEDIGIGTFEGDARENVINLSITNYGSHSGSVGLGKAVKCIIPIKPLPDLRGYRHLRIKFADGGASYFNNLSELDLTPGGNSNSCIGFVIGNVENKIFHKKSDMVNDTIDYTGKTFSFDNFGDYTQNPTSNTIELYIKMNDVKNGHKSGYINIEKIWITET